MPFSIPASATTISGVITNGTTGKPQPGVQVTLIQLQGGMVPVGDTVTDSGGRFRFDSPPPAGEMPFLLRADYHGVAYHAPARPKAASAPGPQGAGSEVSLEVFDTTTERAAVRLASHHVIVEPRAGRLLVEETYSLSNESAPRKTFAGTGRDKQTFRFTVAEGQVQEVQVTASGPRSVPLRQNATELPGREYGIEFPLRPGQTTVEVSYRLPYDSSFTFRKPAGRPSAGRETAAETVIIAPLEGVTLSGRGLASTGRDESKGAQFFRSSAAPLEFQIAGVMPGAPDAGGSEGGESQVSTVVNPNFVYQVRWKILIVLGIALALGLVYLYRLGLAPPEQAGRARARSSGASKIPAGAGSGPRK